MPVYERLPQRCKEIRDTFVVCVHVERVPDHLRNCIYETRNKDVWYRRDGSVSRMSLAMITEITTRKAREENNKQVTEIVQKMFAQMAGT